MSHTGNVTVIKKGKDYFLHSKDGVQDIHVGIDAGNERIVTHKSWEKNQIWYKMQYRGSVSLNASWLAYSLQEGKTQVWINYSKGDMHGRILCDIDALIKDGIEEVDTKPPYDKQLVIPRKLLLESMDETAKKIHKEIWDEKKLQMEQNKKYEEIRDEIKQGYKPFNANLLSQWIK